METNTATVIELTPQQCIDLACLKYIIVDHEIWYLKSKHQPLNEALATCGSTDRIYGNVHMHYILSKSPKP
jgi:hypothetical protein